MQKFLNVSIGQDWNWSHFSLTARARRSGNVLRDVMVALGIVTDLAVASRSHGPRTVHEVLA